MLPKKPLYIHQESDLLYSYTPSSNGRFLPSSNGRINRARIPKCDFPPLIMFLLLNLSVTMMEGGPWNAEKMISFKTNYTDATEGKEAFIPIWIHPSKLLTN